MIWGVKTPSWAYQVLLKPQIVKGEVSAHWDVEYQSVILPVRLPVDDHPGWWVTGTFVVTRTDLRLVSLSIDRGGRSPAPDALTVNVLRAVRFESLSREAHRLLLDPPSTGPWFNISVNDFHERPRPGRRGRSDLEYAEIARHYVEFLSTSATPTKTLAEYLKMSTGSASSFVHEARRRKLLTRTERGKPGGQLTDKAIALLRRASNVGKETR
jgi:hypothetical protein